jgi:hypothetical protein
MQFAGRDLAGFVCVDPEGFADDDALVRLPAWSAVVCGRRMISSRLRRLCLKYLSDDVGVQTVTAAARSRRSANSW